jgi:hypothetical protein
MKKIFCQGWEWNLILFSVFIAMILPELAGIGIIIVLIRVFTGNFRAIIQSRLNQGLGFPNSGGCLDWFRKFSAFFLLF